MLCHPAEKGPSGELNLLLPNLTAVSPLVALTRPGLVGARHRHRVSAESSPLPSVAGSCPLSFSDWKPTPGEPGDRWEDP